MRINSAHNLLCHIAVQPFVLLAAGNALAQTVPSFEFDAFLKNPTGTPLSADEMAGYNLFRGKANCNSCHLDGRYTLHVVGNERLALGGKTRHS